MLTLNKKRNSTSDVGIKLGLNEIVSQLIYYSSGGKLYVFAHLANCGLVYNRGMSITMLIQESMRYEV